MIRPSQIEKIKKLLEKGVYKEAYLLVRSLRNACDSEENGSILERLYQIRRRAVRKKVGSVRKVGEFSQDEKVNLSAFPHRKMCGMRETWYWTIRLWIGESGGCYKVVDFQENCVKAVAVSQDLNFVVYGKFGFSGKKKDYTVRVWHISREEWVRVFEGHTGWVTSVAISPNMKSVLSGSMDKTVRLWDMETGKCVGIFKEHTQSVNSVIFSPIGRLAASGSSDTTVRLWDVEKHKCIWSYEEHSSKVNSVAFSPDGKFILSGSSDKTVRLWETETGKCVTILKGHRSDVDLVIFSPDGTYAVSQDHSGIVILWEFDWEYEFPDVDWDDNAEVLIRNFLQLRRPIGEDGISRVGKPQFTEADLDELMEYLTQRGYGWLNPETVLCVAKRMASDWQSS